MRGCAAVSQRRVPEPFGVVFLDPPFGSELLVSAARRLAERGWLLPQARIYVESPARAGEPELPGAFSAA